MIIFAEPALTLRLKGTLEEGMLQGALRSGLTVVVFATKSHPMERPRPPRREDPDYYRVEISDACNLFAEGRGSEVGVIWETTRHGIDVTTLGALIARSVWAWWEGEVPR